MNAQAGLRVHVLGAFRVEVGARVVDAALWKQRRARHLLALLALAPGGRLHREQIMEQFWPELEPTAAANNLRYTRHTIRAGVEPLLPAGARLVALDGELVVLSPDMPVWIDVVAFENAVAAARRADTPADLQRAADLYTGDLLPADRFEDFVVQRRETLRDTYLALLLQLADQAEQRGQHPAAIDALRRIIAADMTHEEAHAGLMRLYSVTGQRPRALRQFEQLRATLSRELAVEPASATVRLHADILAGRIARAAAPAGTQPQPQPSTPRAQLPALLTPLLGRSTEVAELRQLFGEARLITLIGPGGVGKTSLALELAAAVAGRFPDGVSFVPLASAPDHTLVLPTIAAALGLRETGDQPLQATLARALHDRQLLLVLDNLEHLRLAAPAIGELLAACPRLTMLATSRAPLNLRGERRYPVRPLALPDEELPMQPDELARVPAVRLFVERAQAVNPELVSTPDSLLTIAAICRRLDGLPLAIELAAARTALLSPAAILTRLSGRLQLLTGGSVDLPERQRTLRSTIAWSYELLEASEQALFRQLAVFAGGWTLASAEAVCVGDGDLLDSLTTLVEASLVRQELSGAEPRFGLLETIREYALELLEQHGQAAVVRDRHVDACLRLAELAGPRLEGSEQAEWIRRLDAELGNLRAALGWLRERADAARGLRLLGLLGEFWSDRDGLSAGLAQVEFFLKLPAENPAKADRARALGVAGWIAAFRGDYAASIQFSEAAWALWQRLGEQSGIPFLCVSLGMATYLNGDETRGEAYWEEGVHLARALGDARSLARALSNLGTVARERMELDLATTRFGDALTAARDAGDLDSIALVLLNLAGLAMAHGDDPRSAALCRECWLLYRVLGNQWGVMSCLELYATLALRHGLAAHATRLYGAADVLHIRFNIADQSEFEAERAEGLRTLRLSLGDNEFESAWSRGQAMTLDELSAEALANVDSWTQGPHAP